jgi:hypothetical protein
LIHAADEQSNFQESFLAQEQVGCNITLKRIKLSFETKANINRPTGVHSITINDPRMSPLKNHKRTLPNQAFKMIP